MDFDHSEISTDIDGSDGELAIDDDYDYEDIDFQLDEIDLDEGQPLVVE